MKKIIIGAVFVLVVGIYGIYKSNQQSELVDVENGKVDKSSLHVKSQVNNKDSLDQSKMIAPKNNLKKKTRTKFFKNASELEREYETIAESLSDISEYSQKLNEFYDLENSDFINNIEEVYKHYQVIKKWKAKNEKTLAPRESINPKLAYTLAVALEREVGGIVDSGLKSLSLSSADISALNRFITTQDFDKLNMRDRLTKTELNLVKLKQIYSNAPETISKDGVTHGKASDERPDVAIPEPSSLVD